MNPKVHVRSGTQDRPPDQKQIEEPTGDTQEGNRVLRSAGRDEYAEEESGASCQGWALLCRVGSLAVWWGDQASSTST